MICPVAILSGGRATRLGRVAESTPKAMLDVGGRPFVFRQLELLQKNGVSEVVILVGHLAQAIEDAVGDGARFGLRVSYSHDGPSPLGTGGAIRKALPLLGGEFMVLYGDSYLPCDYGAVYQHYKDNRCRGLMTIYRNADRLDKSNVVYRGERIVRYEKNVDDPDMEYIDYGLGILDSLVFEEHDFGTVFDVSEVYGRLVAKGELDAFEVKERFYEIGSHSGLAELRSLFS